jgi:hypothetical protein
MLPWSADGFRTTTLRVLRWESALRYRFAWLDALQIAWTGWRTRLNEPFTATLMDLQVACSTAGADQPYTMGPKDYLASSGSCLTLHE